MIGGLGTNFNNPFGQLQPANMIRMMVEQFGTQELKKIAHTMSDEQLTQYLTQHPEALQINQGVSSPFGQFGATSAPNQLGSAFAAASSGTQAAGAASPDQINMSEDSSDASDGDSYDEDDQIPTDEAMSSGQMCGMSDVSGADKAKPYAQQCLGEMKAMKKVLETIQKADQDNSTIGGDISQIDALIQDISGKLKKGKKAADGNYSNPQDPQACEKELTDIVKRGVEIVGNNGVEIEVSEKRAAQLQGGGQQQQAAGGKQAGKGEQNAQAQKQKETQEATKGNQQANKGDEGGGGGDAAPAKPFKILSEPQEVNKELSLDEVQQQPELAAALNASLDETLAMMAAQGKTGEEGSAPQLTIETAMGSPVAQQFNAIGNAGPQYRGGSVFGSQPAAPQFGGPQTVGASGAVGAGKAPGLSSAISAPSGLADKMKKAGIDTNKKFNVKMKEFTPGQAVQVQREEQAGPIKVGKNMGGASMILKPPPLGGIDPATGQIHRIGNIHAADGGKSGIFSATIKEGQPILNLQASKNTVQGDVALPGTKAADNQQVKAA